MPKGRAWKFLPQIFVWGAYYDSCQKRLCNIKYGIEDSISNDDRGSRPGSTSSTPNFSFVQVLVQDLLLKDLLKVITSLEDVTRWSMKCICIKKENNRVFLTGFFSLI